MKFGEFVQGDTPRLLAYLTSRSSDPSGLVKFHYEGPDKGKFESSKYAMRWAGDRIVIIGEYDTSGLYSKVNGADWKGIGREAYAEFKRMGYGRRPIPSRTERRRMGRM